MVRLTRRLAPHYQREVEALYGTSLATEALPEMLELLDQLMGEAPYIGGRSNALSRNLYLSVPLLALHRVLRARGKPVEQIARIIYRGTAAAYSNRLYAVLLRLQGALLFTWFGRQRLRRQAGELQRRRYPGNWVMELLEGDDVDLGVDYTECGIVKYLRAQGAPELAPYVCLLDYPLSDRMHVNLERAMTIAEGVERCPFRYHRWTGPNRVVGNVPHLRTVVDGTATPSGGT